MRKLSIKGLFEAVVVSEFMKLAYHSNILNAVQFYRNVKHCPIDHEDSVTKALVYKRGLPYKRES